MARHRRTGTAIVPCQHTKGIPVRCAPPHRQSLTRLIIDHRLILTEVEKQLLRNCVESTMSAPADGHAQVEHASPVDRRDNICFDRRLDHRERRFGVEVGPVCILLNPIPSRECDGCVWREAFVEGAEVDLGGHLGGDGWFGVSRGACGGVSCS